MEFWNSAGENRLPVFLLQLKESRDACELSRTLCDLEQIHVRCHSKMSDGILLIRLFLSQLVIFFVGSQ